MLLGDGSSGVSDKTFPNGFEILTDSIEVEGAITMAIAISAAFILPDLPHNTRGFTKEELDIAQLRMTEDVGEADVDVEGQGPLDGLWMALKDWKIYIMMITFTTYVIGLSFNAFFVGFPSANF